MNELVKVGVFDPEVVEYAVKLEFGDQGRDFLRIAYDQNSRDIGDYVVNQLNKALMKKITLTKAKQNIGEYVVKLIKDIIISKDIIVTGRLLNSVESKIES
jgi:hypothetical protein